MSARDDYRILYQQERGGGVEAKKALDEIDRLRADYDRACIMVGEQGIKLGLVSVALDRYERVRPEHTYGLGNSCHSFVTAVAEALE